MRTAHVFLAASRAGLLGLAGIASAQQPSLSDATLRLDETVVFQDAQVDGRPLRTFALRSPEPVDAALARIVDGWRGSTQAPMVRATSGGWQIASRLTPQGWETVQMRADAAGSTGFRTLWRHVSGPVQSPRPDWLPRSAKLLHAVTSRDGERHATTVIAILPTAPADAMRELTRELLARGWRQDRIPADRLRTAVSTHQHGDRAVMLLRRPHEELALLIAASPGGAGLTAHHIHGQQ